MSAALVAALPMYDFPWTARANDALWAGLANRLRAAGVEAPLALTRAPDLNALWRDPRLLFAQTCGYPYVSALRQSVALIATPTYGFDGCDGAWHCSFVIARKGAGRALADFRGARAAINAWDSNSGMNVFRAVIAPLAQGRPFFAQVIVTGAHVASVGAVAQGRADVAAIDCVTFALLRRGRPELIAAVEAIATTPLSPGLPFIASAALGAATIGAVRAALFGALADDDLAEARAAIGLSGAAMLSPQDYDRVARFEREAAAAGYPALA